jgi:RNA polymerase-binding transcription factor DksA
VATDLQFGKYRALLVDERQRLIERLTDLGLVQDQRPSSSAVLDSSQVSAWRGEGRSTGVQLQDALEEVDQAIARLDDGTFGTCQSCGRGIAPERLEAMPASRACITCASRA